MLVMKSLLSPKRHSSPSSDGDLESSWESIDFYPEDHVYYDAYSDASLTLNHSNETLNVKQASRRAFNTSKGTTSRKRTKMTLVPCVLPTHRRLSSTSVDDDQMYERYRSTSLKGSTLVKQGPANLGKKMDSPSQGFIFPPPRKSSMISQIIASKALPEGLLISISITNADILNDQAAFRVRYTYCPLWNDAPPFRVSTYRTFYELYDYHLRLYQAQKGEVDDEIRSLMLDFPRPIDGLEGWERITHRLKSLDRYFINLTKVPVTRGAGYVLDNPITRQFLAVRPEDHIDIIGKAQMELDWESASDRKEEAEETESHVDAVCLEERSLAFPEPRVALPAAKPPVSLLHDACHLIPPTIAFPTPFSALSPRPSPSPPLQPPIPRGVHKQSFAPCTPTRRSSDYSMTSLSPQTPPTLTAHRLVTIIKPSIHDCPYDDELPPMSDTTRGDKCMDDKDPRFAHILLVERSTWKTWQVLVDVAVPWEAVSSRLFEIMEVPYGSRVLKGMVHAGGKTHAREVPLSDGHAFVRWVKEAQRFLLLTVWVEEPSSYVG
ncbi:hypothetical protein IAR50_005930 [Cryptococcus sp. DSM 104548]